MAIIFILFRFQTRILFFIVTSTVPVVCSFFFTFCYFRSQNFLILNLALAIEFKTFLAYSLFLHFKEKEQQKKQDALKRKQEAKKLLEEEEAKLGGVAKKSGQWSLLVILLYRFHSVTTLLTQ